MNVYTVTTVGLIKNSVVLQGFVYAKSLAHAKKLFTEQEPLVKTRGGLKGIDFKLIHVNESDTAGISSHSFRSVAGAEIHNAELKNFETKGK